MQGLQLLSLLVRNAWTCQTLNCVIELAAAIAHCHPLNVMQCKTRCETNLCSRCIDLRRLS